MSNVFDYPEPKEEYTFSDAVSDAIERNTYKQDYLDYIINNFDEWLQDNGFMTTTKSLCRVWFNIRRNSIETISVNVLK